MGDVLREAVEAKRLVKTVATVASLYSGGKILLIFGAF